MWQWLCSLQINIGIIVIVGMLLTWAAGSAVFGIGTVIKETVREALRKYRAEPDCTVTETGVGVVEPWQITQEREAWEELMKVFSDQ